MEEISTSKMTDLFVVTLAFVWFGAFSYFYFNIDCARKAYEHKQRYKHSPPITCERENVGVNGCDRAR